MNFMHRPHIVFVDDEQAVLDSFENVLRKERRRWNMTFAVTPDIALARMRDQGVHMVITDMRMPGVDGAEFLAQIKNDFPGAARIVLSGQAEREAIERSIHVAHQYISKPCDMSILKATIERVISLRELLPSETLRKGVGRIEQFPTRPQSYEALSRLVHDPDARLSDFSLVVKSEAALSAKVLQIVNSAYFGAGRKTASVSSATRFLGIDPLRQLAIMFEPTPNATVENMSRFSLDAFHKRSVQTAMLARRFVQNRQHTEEIYTAALLHDIGQLILACLWPSDFACAASLVRKECFSVCDAEREVFGASHTEVGAYALGLWGLPTSIVQTVMRHHQPTITGLNEREIEVLACVYCANEFVEEKNAGMTNGHTQLRSLDMGFLEQAKVVRHVGEWKRLASEPLQVEPTVESTQSFD